MLTQTAYRIIQTRQQCAVCESSNLETAIDLPDLPLTGRFSKQPMVVKPQGIGQKLLFCANCGHAQAAFQVDPSALYDETYSFRTSQSTTAKNGTAFFLNTLNALVGEKRFQCVLDVGCNDLYLLNQLKDRVEICVGVDPIWRGQEAGVSKTNFTVIGKSIEEMDFRKDLKVRPDLIVCRHTLEHIYNPSAVLENLFNIAADGAVFLFEVPGFDGLLERLRFDQIFHQHLQYFSLYSFLRMIEKSGGCYLGHRENYHDWSALCIGFKKEKTSGVTKTVKKHTLTEIKKRYGLFQNQIRTAGETLDALKTEEVYGYGAAGMLPILSYHLNNDLSDLVCVLDDDSAKEGWSYWNLPLSIQKPDKNFDWEHKNIFLTAVDNAGSILKRLLLNRPRRIIYPFNII